MGRNHKEPKEPFWKYIKSKRQDAGGIASLEKGANIISDNKGKAELLFDQFKSAFTKTTDNTLPKTRIQAKTDITPIKIEQKGLEKLLRQVNPNKASGPDYIPNRILKECAEPIAPIL
jgi:hypothetical protein